MKPRLRNEGINLARIKIIKSTNVLTFCNYRTKFPRWNLIKKKTKLILMFIDLRFISKKFPSRRSELVSLVRHFHFHVFSLWPLSFPLIAAAIHRNGKMPKITREHLTRRSLHTGPRHFPCRGLSALTHTHTQVCKIASIASPSIDMVTFNRATRRRNFVPRFSFRGRNGGPGSFYYHLTFALRFNFVA